MTITAGFCGQNGILLCADSQYSGWEKVYKDKLFSFDFAGAMVAFALSGSDSYGRSIIEDCYEAVETMPESERTVWAIRKTIRRAISQGLRDCSSMQDRPGFLIAITTTSENPVLFSSHETAIPKVTDFEFQGSGAYIGNYIMKSLGTLGKPLANLKELVVIGLCIISAAKRNDASCGGGCQFMAIGHMKCMPYVIPSIDIFGSNLDRYESMLRGLMLLVGNPDIPDSIFKQNTVSFLSARGNNRPKRVTSEMFETS
jgi:hypothetical protein